MGKPFLIKRGGKYLKIFRARAKGGKVVNLETSNAEEARKRARAVTRGDYSWSKKIVDDTKRILDGSPDGEPDPVEEEPEVSQEVASSEPAAAGPACGPLPAAAGPPQAGSSPVQQAIPDPVAAANEEAAATGSGPTVAETLKDAAASVGIDLSELTKPENLGGLHIAGQSWLTQKLAVALKLKEPPPLVVPKELLPVVTSLGEAWQKQLAAWNITVVNVSPGWAILGCSAIFALVQFAALAETATPPQEGAPVQGAV